MRTSLSFAVAAILWLMTAVSAASEPTSIGSGCAGPRTCVHCNRIVAYDCDEAAEARHACDAHGLRCGSATQQVPYWMTEQAARERRIRREQRRRQIEAETRAARASFEKWRKHQDALRAQGDELRPMRDEFRKLRQRSLEENPAGTPKVHLVSVADLSPAPADALGQAACAKAHADELRYLLGAQHATAEAGLSGDLSLGLAARLAGEARQVFDTGLARPGCASNRLAPHRAAKPEIVARELTTAVERLADAGVRSIEIAAAKQAAEESVRQLEEKLTERKKQLAPKGSPVPVPTSAEAKTAPTPEGDDPLLREIEADLAKAKATLATAAAASEAVAKEEATWKRRMDGILDDPAGSAR